MSCYPLEVVFDIVALGYDQGKIQILGQGTHSLKAMLVLGIGVDIGVIPQGTHPITLPPPVASSIGSAMSTAAVNQNRANLHVQTKSPQCRLRRLFSIIGKPEVLVCQWRNQAAARSPLQKTQL